jgi:hypothetical protein
MGFPDGWGQLGYNYLNYLPFGVSMGKGGKGGLLEGRGGGMQDAV